MEYFPSDIISVISETLDDYDFYCLLTTSTKMLNYLYIPYLIDPMFKINTEKLKREELLELFYLYSLFDKFRYMIKLEKMNLLTHDIFCNFVDQRRNKLCLNNYGYSYNKLDDYVKTYMENYEQEDRDMYILADKEYDLNLTKGACKGYRTTLFDNHTVRSEEQIFDLIDRGAVPRLETLKKLLSYNTDHDIILSLARKYQLNVTRILPSFGKEFFLENLEKYGISPNSLKYIAQWDMFDCIKDVRLITKFVFYLDKINIYTRDITKTTYWCVYLPQDKYIHLMKILLGRNPEFADTILTHNIETGYICFKLVDYIISNFDVKIPNKLKYKLPFYMNYSDISSIKIEENFTKFVRTHNLEEIEKQINDYNNYCVFKEYIHDLDKFLLLLRNGCFENSKFVNQRIEIEYYNGNIDFILMLINEDKLSVETRYHMLILCPEIIKSLDDIEHRKFFACENLYQMNFLLYNYDGKAKRLIPFHFDKRSAEYLYEMYIKDNTNITPEHVMKLMNLNIDHSKFLRLVKRHNIDTLNAAIYIKDYELVEEILKSDSKIKPDANSHYLADDCIKDILGEYR